MSEYQYYEFQTVDRPLTKNQMAELRRYSTRAQITPTSFINVYNYGDFKGDPSEWMEKYFDAFLYLANWGSCHLMFRVPKRLLSPEVVSAYCTGDSLSCGVIDDYLILSFETEIEEPDWEEGEGWLDNLISLRMDLMSGDFRGFYLGWLIGASKGELDIQDVEPPVPSGLGDLSPSLISLAEFLDLDLDLIAAAAEQSPEGPAFGLSKEDIAKWTAGLSAQEKDDIIKRMLEKEDPLIGVELRQRALRETLSENLSGSHARNGDRRTVDWLVARAEEIAEERQKKEAETRAREKAKHEKEQAAKRKKHIESLIGKEGQLWPEVDQLIASRLPQKYDQAINLLQDLHDLAVKQGQISGFSSRISDLHRQHKQKTSLVDRLRKAKLLIE